ncbi:hypothetical protein [Brevundimonas naejangsanensis]|uniref:hypothetical protein n=1 Tax=Brevundimonas naejangsanensis TaxID=588932 RepID=UPI0026EAD9DC|nr:hypothetical protein [Brevundimonas naejangsanensis]
MGYLLTDNAFARLRVSARARLSKIEEAFEDAVIDAPEAEGDLLKVKQALSSPKPRLEAEIRWLIDLSPKKADEVLSLLQGDAADAVLRFLESHTNGLSAANIAADACGRFGDYRFVGPLIEAHADMTTEAVAVHLRGVRAAAGFAPVTIEQTQDVLQRVRTEHAATVVDLLVRQDQPGSTLARLLSDHTGGMVDALVQAFDRWATPHLRELEEQARTELTALETSGAGDVRAAIALLREWDEISQPVQLHYEAKGLDEPRSLRLYQAARSTAVSLANRHAQYDRAQELSSALLEIFRELPSAKRQLAKDLKDLDALRQDAQREALIEPLQSHVERLRQNLPRVALLLESRDWLAPDLARLDHEFAQCLAEGGLDEMALGVVRSLAIDLNGADRPRAAFELLKRYRERSSLQESDLKTRVAKDLEILRSNADQRDLTRALEAGNLGAASALAAQMLGYERDEKLRAQLMQVRTAADKKNAARTVRYVGWGIVAVLALVFFVFNAANDPTSYVPPPSYPDPYSVDSAASVEADVAAGVVDDYLPEPDPPPAYADGYAPLPPPTNSYDSSTVALPNGGYEDGGSPIFSRSEIETCLADDARLESLRVLVNSNSGIDRYNVLVESYNRRCGSFRYRPGDMTEARTAVNARRSSIQAEAEALAAEWGE